MKVIGIRFKEGGKVYYFAPNENETYAEGMQVVVETSKSTEFAYVASLPKEVDESEVVQPLKPILRIATDRDREQVRRNIERKPQAMKIAQEKIEKHGLQMKLIDCEFAFEGNKVVFYFAADGRVDFRELVKDLASTFRIRIELRQVGIRDETRLLGGFGPCGRECCCAGAMPEFRKVSIKMAKVQGLSLNPGKISGLCGRLMCCLSYENEYYAEAFKKMPKVGSVVATPEGNGTVISDNMLKMTVRVKIEKDGSLVYRDFPVEDIRFKSKKEEPLPEEEGEELPAEESAPAAEERAPREPRKDKERPQGGRRKRNVPAKWLLQQGDCPEQQNHLGHHQNGKDAVDGGKADTQHRRSACQLRDGCLCLRLTFIAHAENRAILGVLLTGKVQHRPAESQTEDHLGDRLDNLRDGGRIHILHSLIVAAVG